MLGIKRLERERVERVGSEMQEQRKVGWVGGKAVKENPDAN